MSKYRYILHRTLDMYAAGSVVFVMLNPSTATETADDPTIRRCVGFARRWRARDLVVVNLFAYRATDPKDLLRAMRAGTDVVGPSNDGAIVDAVSGQGTTIVLAWGAITALVDRRARAVLALLKPRPLWCLGVTSKDHPRHPLFVRADQPLVRWEEASCRAVA